MSETTPTDAVAERVRPPLAIGETLNRPVALVLSVVLTIGYGVSGNRFFLSPGQDAFEGIGYLFGAVLLLLAGFAALAAVLASRGRAEAWALLAIPPALIVFALAQLVP